MNFTLLSRTKIPFWEILLILFLFAAYLLPSFSLGSIMILLLLLVYCVYMMFVDRDLMPIIAISLGFIVFVALFYTLLTDTFTISQSASNRGFKQFTSKLYQYVALYFPAFLFFRINKTATQKQKLLLTGAGLAIMVYVIITTWIYLIENPGATKQWETFGETSQLNIANYYFIYAIPIIIATISIVMMKSKGIPRLISIVLVVVGIVFLVNAQYTLAILIAIIGVLIQIYKNIRSSLNKILFGIAMLAIAIFIPQILAYAISIIPSQQVSQRLSEILDFLVGRGADGYNLNGRLTLYGETIVAFFKSPLWGNRHLDFDGHATFLTILADTGILGGIPFYALLVAICKHMKKQLGSHQTQFGVIIIMFCLMGLTNPIHSSLALGLTTWFLAPLTIQMILKEDPTNG